MYDINRKKCSLTFGKGPIDELDDTTVTAEAEYSIIFIEQKKKFWLSLNFNESNNYLFVNGEPDELCLGNISQDFTVNRMKNTRFFR